MLNKAIEFARLKHLGQVRKVSKEPYINHPLHVLELLLKYKTSKNIEVLSIVAVLHDTVEDTNTTLQEITTEFGSFVASLVEELTSNESAINEIGKNEYLKIKLLNLSSYALTLKLLDRLSNISDHPSQKYKSDTIELLKYINQHRDLNKTQSKIIIDILLLCI